MSVFTATQTQTTHNQLGQIDLRHAPPVPGLRFRRFRGDADYPAMAAVIEGSKEADGIERVDSAEDVANAYRHLTNCDPYRDMLFAEIEGSVIGYSRVWWSKLLDSTRLYGLLSFMLPDWRGRGIRRDVLDRCERRLADIARSHPSEGEKFFETWAADSETHWESLLASKSYSPVRYHYNMVRPDLEDIPELPLPDGLEVRPVPPEHYRTVWKAEEEAFRDHWGALEWQEEWFEENKESRNFQPHLWQVAWDGEEVAGMVLNFVDERENEIYDRKRGWTEDIAVRRPYRRQGLAKALIARSLKLHKGLGMTEAALGVDVENPNGALRLYQSMGFRQVKKYTTYRRPVP